MNSWKNLNDLLDAVIETDTHEYHGCNTCFLNCIINKYIKKSTVFDNIGLHTKPVWNKTLQVRNRHKPGHKETQSICYWHSQENIQRFFFWDCFNINVIVCRLNFIKKKQCLFYIIIYYLYSFLIKDRSYLIHNIYTTVLGYSLYHDFGFNFFRYFFMFYCIHILRWYIFVLAYKLRVI